MDIQRLRDIARDLMEIPDMADDFRYFVGSFAVMLSDDPLTLDAAVVAMGSEPDEQTPIRAWWDDAKIELRKQRGETLIEHACVRPFQAIVSNPTIGQFALLVAAARMGEKA